MADKLSERLEARLALRAGVPDFIKEPAYVDSEECRALLREAAELARRVEGAPSVEITACNQIEGALDFDYGDMVAAAQKFDAGQRVRLVPEPPEAE